MKPVEDILYDLVLPLVEEEKSLSVKRLPSLDENEIMLAIYADSADIARLIGRQGTMAHAIRQTMAIGSRVLDQRISIKFESY
ncbi:KH domain-containing protein [Erysipelothrix rhusiopathiae]|uniref:KH domain-containing protein n=1 Tax=Erysipelothrix rhusiopathiae TaxID=1648 RepID=UPI001EDDB25C|nr:KH domain-containing protein [Erysipelothrix rhusiopathiae]MCG4436597.1 KH domain-containing protein [Erysipelothrix rhusiopathiae]MDE8333956.1 KH domain-containing protein [Erysipelothrix rhusiopathiae]